MELLKKLMSDWKHRRAQARVNKATAIVNAAGLTVCRIVEVSGSHYIVDSQGAMHKIGRARN